MLVPQRPNSEKTEMNFHELEESIKKKEAEARKAIIPSLVSAASQISLEMILDIVGNETVLSTHPRVNKDGRKLRVAILQVPDLRGKYYVIIKDETLSVFRDGYTEPLAIHKGDQIKETYDYLNKHFWGLEKGSKETTDQK